jgi:signal transduction histidine kinase
MAARIDGLIVSHKEMSNAVSHEIRTPLARMQFEIDSAEQAQELGQVRSSLSNLKGDIAQINDLVSATLKYAILERADMALNIGVHDFTTLVPAVAEYVGRDAHVTFIGHKAVNQLIVDDDGPGIPEKDRKRVFESFIQLDHAEGRKTGFGLGLAIVKRSLEWHAGEVSIGQSPLGGARICATWPSRPDAQA